MKFLHIVALLTALSGCDNKVATIQPPPPGTLHCFAPDGSVLVVAPESGTHGASGNVITWSQGGQLHFTSLPCVGTLKGS